MDAENGPAGLGSFVRDRPVVRDIDKPWRTLPWMTTRIFRERWHRLYGESAIVPELSRLNRPWIWFYGTLLAILAEMWIAYLTRLSMPWWGFLLVLLVTIAAGIAGGCRARGLLR